MGTLLLRGGTIVRTDSMEKADVVIENNVIVSVGAYSHTPLQGEIKIIDIHGKLIFPGLIDCHVHFREPGLTHKEDMESGSRAAIAGGVTTVCEMPNTVPPTVTVEAFTEKVRLASKIRKQKLEIRNNTQSPISNLQSPSCDIRFFFGATEHKHLIALRKIWINSDHHLQELKKQCCGLKLYLDHSTGNQKAEHGVIEEAFRLCGELQIPVVCHCEDPGVNHESRIMNHGGVEQHSLERPPESEERAVAYAIDLACRVGARHGVPLHIAHLSTKSGLELVRQAKRDCRGVLQYAPTVTCEVAPHHLFLTIDDYEKLGTLGKMNPPLRTSEHQEALWQGIFDGTIDCISTDHAPHTLEEKHVDDWRKAPSGVPGVETMLPLLLSVAAGGWPHPDSRFEIRDSRLGYADIVRLCFENPNRIFNLGKQGITEGAPADVMIVDPEREWTVEAKNLHYKCRWSPYEGWRVRGIVENMRMACRP